MQTGMLVMVNTTSSDLTLSTLYWRVTVLVQQYCPLLDISRPLSYLAPTPHLPLCVFLSVAPGSFPTWMTPSWMTLCPESMCCICDPVDRCSSSSHISGSSPASLVARIRHTTSSPTSPSANSLWSVSAFIIAHVLAVYSSFTFDNFLFCCLSVPTGRWRLWPMLSRPPWPSGKVVYQCPFRWSSTPPQPLLASLWRSRWQRCWRVSLLILQLKQPLKQVWGPLCPFDGNHSKHVHRLVDTVYRVNVPRPVREWRRLRGSHFDIHMWTVVD